MAQFALSGNVRFVRLFMEVLWRGNIKQELRLISRRRTVSGVAELVRVIMLPIRSGVSVSASDKTRVSFASANVKIIQEAR